MLWEKGHDGESTIGFPTFVDWQAQNHTIASMAAMSDWNQVLASGGDPEILHYGMVLAVRSEEDPTRMADTIRQANWSVGPDVLISQVDSIDRVISTSVAQPRFTMLLLVFFAGTALLMSAMGIYGVAAFGVAQRTQEIGTRMALGALPRDVLRLVLRQGLRLLVIGVLVGLAGALVLTRFLRSLLFEISPTDPATFAAVAVLLCVVGFMASYLPARRATRIDPMIALRHE